MRKTNPKTRPTRVTYTELPVWIVEAVEKVADENDRSRSKQIKVCLEEWLRGHNLEPDYAVAKKV